MKTATRKQFTLIELLIVIAIIGILAGLMFPAFSVVRNNARRSKANSECQGLKTAIILYETEFSCWPADISGSNDGVLSSSEYIKMCKVLTGENGKKMVCYEVGVGYDENKGILDPWGRQYQIALDNNYDNKLSESNVPAVKAVNSVNGRSGQDLRTRVAVYSYGCYENEKDAKDIDKLAKRKKLVTSW